MTKEEEKMPVIKTSFALKIAAVVLLFISGLIGKNVWNIWQEASSIFATKTFILDTLLALLHFLIAFGILFNSYNLIRKNTYTLLVCIIFAMAGVEYSNDKMINLIAVLFYFITILLSQNCIRRYQRIMRARKDKGTQIYLKGR